MMPRRTALRCRTPLIVLAIVAASGCKDEKKEKDTRTRPELPSAEATARVATAESDRADTIGVITQVLLQTLDPESDVEAKGIDARALGVALGRQLSESPRFASLTDPIPEGRRGRKVEVQVLVAYDIIDQGSEGGPSLVASAEARLRWLDGEPTLVAEEAILIERRLEKGARGRPGALISEQVAAAVAAAGRGLIAKETVRTGTDAEVLSALSAEDSGLAAWALEVAGDRKLSEAVPEAVAALESEDEHVADAAFGALVAIGDPAAVEALAKNVDFKDYDQTRAVIEAAGHLGGSEATAFLEFVASGHPDPGIRDRAAEALERLSARGLARETQEP